jgi:hypothetical protein
MQLTERGNETQINTTQKLLLHGCSFARVIKVCSGRICYRGASSRAAARVFMVSSDAMVVLLSIDMVLLVVILVSVPIRRVHGLCRHLSMSMGDKWKVERKERERSRKDVTEAEPRGSSSKLISFV